MEKEKDVTNVDGQTHTHSQLRVSIWKFHNSAKCQKLGATPQF